ncbi:MAG: (Fe-S)-binding protein [Deltaproteobacteria bacterium]|nr:(Fe-S)-binding protein [Deltaproteobacteria bacterium]
MNLQVISTLQDRTQTCSYCPKLCRPACPVATVEGNDAHSAWGLMNALDDVTMGRAEMDATLTDAVYACTGCGACRAHCELDIDVVGTVLSARADARRNSVSTDKTQAVRESLAKRSARVSRREHNVGRVARAGEVVLLVGCSDRSGASLRSLEPLLSKWLGVSVWLAEDLCCGMPWREAGELQESSQHLAALAERMKDASELVALDAGCTGFLKTEARDPMPRVVSSAVFWERVLARAELPDFTGESLAIHDSCRTGRALGIFAEPRNVIAKITGRSPIELRASKRESLCSGGGGLLPLTYPNTADAMTRELAGLVRESGASRVVVGCSTTQARLTREGIKAMTLERLLVEWLVGPA